MAQRVSILPSVLSHVRPTCAKQRHRTTKHRCECAAIWRWALAAIAIGGALLVYALVEEEMLPPNTLPVWLRNAYDRVGQGQFSQHRCQVNEYGVNAQSAFCTFKNLSWDWRVSEWTFYYNASLAQPTIPPYITLGSSIGGSSEMRVRMIPGPIPPRRQFRRGLFALISSYVPNAGHILADEVYPVYQGMRLAGWLQEALTVLRCSGFDPISALESKMFAYINATVESCRPPRSVTLERVMVGWKGMGYSSGRYLPRGQVAFGLAGFRGHVLGIHRGRREASTIVRPHVLFLSKDARSADHVPTTLNMDALATQTAQRFPVADVSTLDLAQLGPGDAVRAMAMADVMVVEAGAAALWAIFLPPWSHAIIFDRIVGGLRERSNEHLLWLRKLWGLKTTEMWHPSWQVGGNTVHVDPHAFRLALDAVMADLCLAQPCGSDLPHTSSPRVGSQQQHARQAQQYGWSAIVCSRLDSNDESPCVARSVVWDGKSQAWTLHLPPYSASTRRNVTATLVVSSWLHSVEAILQSGWGRVTTSPQPAPFVCEERHERVALVPCDSDAGRCPTAHATAVALFTALRGAGWTGNNSSVTLFSTAGALQPEWVDDMRTHLASAVRITLGNHEVLHAKQCVRYHNVLVGWLNSTYGIGSTGYHWQGMVAADLGATMHKV